MLGPNCLIVIYVDPLGWVGFRAGSGSVKPCLLFAGGAQDLPAVQSDVRVTCFYHAEGAGSAGSCAKPRQYSFQKSKHTLVGAPFNQDCSGLGIYWSSRFI